DRLVTNDACDFFDEVDLAREVEAPARRSHFVAGGAATWRCADRREHRLDALVGHVGAEHCAYTRGPHAHRASCGGARPFAHDSAFDLSAGDLDEQLRGAKQRTLDARAVDATLEAIRRVGDHAVAPRRAAYERRREHGALDEQIGRRSAYGGELAA